MGCKLPRRLQGGSSGRRACLRFVGYGLGVWLGLRVSGFGVSASGYIGSVGFGVLSVL